MRKFWWKIVKKVVDHDKYKENIENLQYFLWFKNKNSEILIEKKKECEDCTRCMLHVAQFLD